VIDGDPTTVWRTDQYRQQFPSSLKPGVGIMATFGQPVKLTEVDIDSPSAGTVVQIRTATTAVPHLADTQIIGTATLTNGHTVIQLNPGPPVQYVLVWIGTLANTGHYYQSMIGEITFVQAQ
jgi:putative peptidoglycan lipid II flippase